MSKDKITYSDVKEYERLFTMAPSFLLEKLARRNTNLVSKFKPIIQGYMDDLTADQKTKLDIILASEVQELQDIMHEAYLRSKKRQYKVLANPKYRQFIEDNLDGIRRML